MSLPLVDYSSSSSDNEDDVAPTVASNSNEPVKKMSLPNPLKDTSSNEERQSSRQDGRIRSFPHERGIWSTYVHIPCLRSEQLVSFQCAVKKLLENHVQTEGVEVHNLEDIHMSLTKTVILRHHWIDEFINSLQKDLSSFHRFWIDLNCVQVYCNEEKTRTFISLSIEDESVEKRLAQLVRRLDRCLAEFNLPPFYENPSFHVSILWCLGDRKAALDELKSELQTLLNEKLAVSSTDFQIDVRHLFCQIGNKLFTIG